MKYTRTLLTTLLLASLAALYAEEPAELSLQGGDFRVTFDPSGCVRQFVHVPSGQTLISAEQQAAAYALTFEDATGKTTESAGVKQAAVEKLSDGLGFVCEDQRACVTMTYRVAADGLEARIAVENRTTQALVGVKFPILQLPEKLGATSEDDRLLFPFMEGAEMDDPGANMKKHGGVSGTYPGPLSCQVMAYYDKMAGLCVSTHDPDGYPKRFDFRRPGQFEMSVTHLGPSLPGAALAPTYPVHIAPFVGDWTGAAAAYRRWAEQRPWAKHKLATHAPAWLLKNGVFAVYAPERKGTDVVLGRLEREFADFKWAGVPLHIIYWGWEHNGMWTGQEYLPPYPSADTFREVAARTRKQGGRGVIFLSGYRWTIEKDMEDGSLYSSADRFEREVSPFAVCDITGKPVISQAKGTPSFQGRRWAHMCRATEFTKRTMTDVARYAVESGYSVVHLDQVCSGDYPNGICYSRDHGHPPGHGRYVYEAVADLFQRFADTCRPLDKDLVLSIEEPNELFLPWLTLFQCRVHKVGREWPCPPQMHRSVPLFVWLYHDSQTAWADFYGWDSSGHPRYGVAKGTAAGLLSGFAWPFPNQPTNEEQRLYTVLSARCVKAFTTFAHEYLTIGHAETNLPLDVPQRTLAATGKERKGQPFRVPAVSHGVWSLPDGRRAVIFVNPEPEARDLDVDLRSAGIAYSTTVRIVSTTGGESRANGPATHVRVPALDLLMIETTAVAKSYQLR